MIARNEEIIFSSLDEETVMMSIEKGLYYGLDKVGRRLWEMLETPCLVSDMCGRLVDEYDVSPEQCSSDVLVFLDRMIENSLVIVHK